jgi:Cu+-exporting ATPase
MISSVDCKVSGMTCGNCALTITNYLNKQGAQNAVANPATGDVSFTISEDLNKDTILNGIENLGYPLIKETEGLDEITDSHSKEKKLFLVSLIFWIPLIAHMFISWSPIT